MRKLWFLWIGLCCAATIYSEDIVAVAAGIAPCVEEVTQAFVAQGGEPLNLVKGPSAPLAIQMASGAAYDLLLEAELRWPKWLEAQGGLKDLGVFAKGRLVLWYDKEIPPTWEILREGVIAVPEPDTTAYGMLARDYLSQKGLWDQLNKNGSLVFLKSAPQAILAVKYGAAIAALVPQCIVMKAGGSYLLISEAVIDHTGGLSPAAGQNARDFWNFCRSPVASPIWRKWGFEPVLASGADSP